MKLLWLDLETTGLVPQTCQILEVAACVADLERPFDDLAFINRWMPRLAKCLHYRVFDVSSVLLFARAMGMPRPAKAEAHRAMADVRESIELGRACASWLSKAATRWMV